MGRRQRGLEYLEPRIVLDAAPYVVHVQTWGMMAGSGHEFTEPFGSFSGTLPFSSTADRAINVVPGAAYADSGGFYETLRLGQDPFLDASMAASISGFFYHTDEVEPIGQPERANLILDGEAFASASYQAFPLPYILLGTSQASLRNVTTARLRIWDADCPIVGIPVKGTWTLTSQAGERVHEPFPGTARLEQEVTIRYWRAVAADEPLVLDKTLTTSIPVGDGQFLTRVLEREFELTTGSEIEVEVSTDAAASSTSAADFNHLEFEISQTYAQHVTLLDFEHYTRPSGAIDPQWLPAEYDPRWLAVEYEVKRPICYFDLELGAVVADATGPSVFNKFRIDPEIIEENPRFRLADPDTGELRPASAALDIGRHWLLIDGRTPSLQAQFADITNELLVVQEPGFAEAGQEFHGFFQATPADAFVVRSDADTEDQVVLNGTTAEFRYGSETYVHDFGEGAAKVVVVTAGEDDVVLAFPSFALPIEASLGAGQDVFVGGANQDLVHGGTGNDALLGEGWTTDVTSLISLFQDMLDLKFSLQAGLEPADGAADLLYGQEGDDFLLGGAGGDRLEAGPGRAVMFGDSLRLTAAIEVDFNDLKFAADVDFVRSGAGADTLIGGDDDTLIMGGGGGDTITGNTAGISLLFGNAGDDTITGRSAFDVIAGGAGDDTITGGGFLIGDSFAFSTFSSTNFDALKQGNFTVGVKLTSEDAGRDTITGSGGFDFIVGGEGDDTISGGNGLNVVFGDAFDITLSIGFDFTNMFSTDRFLDILLGPLKILNLFDLDFDLVGSGADSYQGGSDTDVVFGGGGNDTLRGNAGFDFIVGGEGDDTINVGDDFFFSAVIGDVGFGGPGDDTITGSDGPDHLESELGRDTFLGRGGDDRLYGGADPDVLYGGPGDDWLYGEGGDDQLFGDEGDDHLVGGLGTDSLDGGGDNNTLTQESAAPVLTVAAAVSFVAAQPAVLIAGQGTLTDEDSAAFLGGHLTVANAGTPPGDDLLEIQHQGFAAEQIGLQGSQVFYGGLVIGELSGGVGATPLVVTLNQRATPAATQALVRSVTFRSLNDLPSTAARSIQVSLDDGDGGASDPATATISVAVTRAVPGIAIGEPDGFTSVNENGATDSFQVVLTAPPQSAVIVRVTSGDPGEATVSPADLIFGPADWKIPQAVTVTGVNDQAVDGTQSTILTVAVVDEDSDDQFDAVADQQLIVATIDDDAVPVVTLSVAPAEIDEAAGVSTVTATLSAAYRLDVTVELGFSGTATIADDYFSSGTQIVIPAGQTSGAVTLTAVQDALHESSETIVVDIVAVTNGNEAATQQVTAAISDDDPLPTVRLDVAKTLLAEPPDSTLLTASLSAPSSFDVTVQLDFGGTATPAEDYISSATQIVIPAGSTSGSLSLASLQDALDEADETVLVQVASVTQGTELGEQQVTVWIADDDAAPAITLSLAPETVSEAGGTATVTASLSAASGRDVTVVLGLSGTAARVQDYALSATQIVIPAGETSGTVSLTMWPDSADELDENITLDIVGVLNGSVAGAAQVTAWIQDDDPPPVVALSVAPEAIEEAAGISTVTASLSVVSGLDVTVELGFGGTASRPGDYTSSAAQILIPAGQTTGSVVLTAVYDELEEPDETILVNIAGVTNATPDAGAEQAAVTILNAQIGIVRTFAKIADDGQGGPQLQDDDYFGSSVVAVGDLDGDGVTDLAVGAEGDDTGADLYGDRGAVHILLLNADGTLKSRVKLASGINGGPLLADGDYFGSSLAAVGDLDGDGVADLAVGAKGDDTGGEEYVERGAVYLLLLNSNGSVKSSIKLADSTNGGPALADEDFFGSALAAMGDLDGDGVTDLAVGAPGDDSGGEIWSDRGALHILLLNADGTVKNAVRIADGAGGGPALAKGDYFGSSLAALGDLDGDGVLDLAVGAEGDDTGGEGFAERGAVHVLLLNADGSVKSSVKLASGLNGGPALADWDYFGSSLAAPGDLDGDGIADLAVGAEGDDSGGEIWSDRGAVHILLLNADGTAKSSLKLASEMEGGPLLSDADYFGNSLASLGDLDGDGMSDLAVGARGDDGGDFGVDRGAVHVLFLRGPSASASVAGRYVFYNQSHFDGHNAAADENDDQAIATDKLPLLPGGTASFANYTGFRRGLNGIMVDIQGLADAQGLTTASFEFHVGNSGDPSAWSPAPAPATLTVRSGQGIGGSDRVTLTWPNGVIANGWLRVTVLADGSTGLAQPDIFYFGNAIGETGNLPTNSFVDGSDFAGARDNPRSFLIRAPIEFPYDFNRDSFVDGTDLAIARDHPTNFLTALQLIAAPSAAPVSPPEQYLGESEPPETGALPEPKEPAATSPMIGVAEPGSTRQAIPVPTGFSAPQQPAPEFRRRADEDRLWRVDTDRRSAAEGAAWIWSESARQPSQWQHLDLAELDLLEPILDEIAADVQRFAGPQSVRTRGG